MLGVSANIPLQANDQLAIGHPLEAGGQAVAIGFRNGYPIGSSLRGTASDQQTGNPSTTYSFMGGKSVVMIGCSKAIASKKDKNKEYPFQ